MIRPLTFFSALAFAALACTLTPEAPTPSPLPPTSVPEPTLVPPTPVPPTVTPQAPSVTQPPSLKFGPPDGAEIVYSFTDHLCEAAWTNNARAFDCPGDLSNTEQGYVAILEQPQLGNILIDNTVILNIPAHAGLGLASFGRFPARTIEAGDRFYAGLACLSETCNVEFALEYFDAQGNYHDDLAIAWPYEPGASSPVIADVSLDALAGQTVELTLVVRNRNVNNIDEALWIAPVIWRVP